VAGGGRKCFPIRNWVLHCDSGHSYACKASDKLSLPNFRVIDCETREIMLAPQDCQYVALSYVWGTSKQSSPELLPLLPSPAVLVVEDALIATLSVGLRYLWVDQYCIDQTDAATIHALIQSMDAIYGGASITFIDALGDGAESGLPGVSLAHRLPQISINLSEFSTEITMVPSIQQEVSAAQWSTRAWTYQECLLSCRCLVFAPSQVYFQCWRIHCCETICHNSIWSG
jgi:hypothetical protein